MAILLHLLYTSITSYYQQSPNKLSTNYQQTLKNIVKFLLNTRQTMQFNPASDYWPDVVGFMAHLTAYQTHAHADLARHHPYMKRL